MRTILITVTVIIILAATAVGWSTLGRYVPAARQVLEDDAVKRMPVSVHEAAIRQEIASQRRTLTERHVKVATNEQRLQNLRRQEQSLGSQIVDQERSLARAIELIEQGQSTYQIGGRSFTRQEVIADARLRTDRLDSLRRRQDDTRQAIQSGEAAQAEARINLAGTDAAIAAKEQKLLDLLGRNESAEVRIDLAQIAEETRQDSHFLAAGSDSAFAAFERVVEENEAKAEVYSGRHAGQIDYTSGDDVLDRARRSLGSSKAAATPRPSTDGVPNLDSGDIRDSAAPGVLPAAAGPRLGVDVQ